MKFLRWWFCLVVALPLALQAQTPRLALQSYCSDHAIPVEKALAADAPWLAVPNNLLEMPIRQTCWLRISRLPETLAVGDTNNQFLAFENSWGSNYSLYAPSGELLARSTVSGERLRVLADKGWVYSPLTVTSPQVLYAQVESLNKAAHVRHSFFQRDGQAVLRLQKRLLLHMSAGWILLSAAIFSFLFFLFQRNRHYALFSGFALLFALTLFLDRGELAPFGLTASSDWLSLAYPLSGLLLAWLALAVGQFAVHTPFVAWAIRCVMALYAALAASQLAIALGLRLSGEAVEDFSELVYNTAALLQLCVLWGSFRAWRRGDKTGILLAIGVIPLILFEIQISDWFANLLPTVSAPLSAWLGSSLRITSYLLLPCMFFIAIAYRAQKSQRDAIWLAQQDQLTGLPNRDHFLRLGQSKLDHHPNATMLAINIDRLKAINDVLGFAVGDAVIMEAAQRLSKIQNGLVARVQTTQFCILLSDHAQLPATRQQLEAAFSKPVLVMGQTLDVALSIGVAHHQGEPVARLMRDTEIALAVAKATKVNWLVYQAAMDTTRPESLSLLSELNRAIAEGELRLYLQPKVNLSTGQISGAEALVRWQHPTRGMVPPNDFIPFAEQTGKISALTLWVVREGARIAALWRAQGRPIIISLNISTHDLRESQFVRHVVEIVNDQSALPQDLRLEVTESGMMDDPETSLTVLNALRDAGFSLSIDDFGTGYSSLSYLQRMPVTELKIDRSFVSTVVAASEGAALLDSIITLGHRMGLTVVAEGAETGAECALLQSLGCDFVQGWFVAKAMPVAEFEIWREHNNPFSIHTGFGDVS
jgi:diguanylate cyclase (GGDEF)-like protein